MNTNTPIPDPIDKPLDYLRLISRDLRVRDNSVAANGVLDAISSLRARERVLVDALKTAVDNSDDESAERVVRAAIATAEARA